MSEVKRRLKTYIQSQGIREAEFERRCGFSRGYVSSIQNTITPDKALNILEWFPSLNFDWLLTGRGSLNIGDSHRFLSQTERSCWEEMVRVRQKRIEKLEGKVLELQTELDYLKGEKEKAHPQ